MTIDIISILNCIDFEIVWKTTSLLLIHSFASQLTCY
jgi:hypothetical protein